MSELIQPLPTALSGLERRPPPEGNAVDALLARAYGSLRARAASPASLARLGDQVLAQAAALDAADAAALASERDALRLALRLPPPCGRPGRNRMPACWGISRI